MKVKTTKIHYNLENTNLDITDVEIKMAESKPHTQGLAMELKHKKQTQDKLKKWEDTLVNGLAESINKEVLSKVLSKGNITGMDLM